MRNFLLDKCEIKKMINDRFKVNVVSIEPYVNQVNFNLNAVSSQNNVYTWRFDKDIIVNGVITASLEFPFFVGHVKLNPYNDDPVFVNTSGFWISFLGYDLATISTFYGTVTQQWKAYADNVTFNGPVPPSNRFNETMDNLNNPKSVIGPYMQIQVFTNGTGALSLSVAATFEGYRLYLS